MPRATRLAAVILIETPTSMRSSDWSMSFRKEPVASAGAVTTPMRGLLTPGHVIERRNGAMTLECMDYNIPDLPKSFGGTSGGGLWRMYLNRAADGSYEHAQTRLCGVASFQRDANHIVCQGIERIEQTLLPAIRRHWGAEPAQQAPR